MTLKQIEKRVAEIQAMKSEQEREHETARLYIDTLREVVDLMPNTRAGRLAAAALEATKITR